MGTISTIGDGPNAFSIVYRGTASDTHPAIIQVPEVTAREASLALSVAGAERVDIDGRLALRVRAPTATIRIAYASSWMTAGLWCTGLGLVVFSYLVVSAMAGRRRAAAPPAAPA
jgi:hypothetical protein